MIRKLNHVWNNVESNIVHRHSTKNQLIFYPRSFYDNWILWSLRRFFSTSRPWCEETWFHETPMMQSFRGTNLKHVYHWKLHFSSQAKVHWMSFKSKNWLWLHLNVFDAFVPKQMNRHEHVKNDSQRNNLFLYSINDSKLKNQKFNV